MKKMTKSFSIRNGKIEPFKSSMDSPQNKKAKNIPSSHLFPQDMESMTDAEFNEYMSNTSNVSSFLEDDPTESWMPDEYKLKQIEEEEQEDTAVELKIPYMPAFVDEIDNPTMFSNDYPIFHQTELSMDLPNNFNKISFHASQCMKLPDENSVFFHHMVKYKKKNLFDPYFNLHRKLCEEWIKRHERGLRQTYFSFKKWNEELTVEEVAPIFVRYHGRDSIVLQMETYPWPLKRTDPSGKLTFKDCDRPLWLLKYIYTIMLSTLDNEKEKEDVLFHPEKWNSHVNEILFSTNLPYSMLHPIELETEEGNYFPVTPKEFSEWLTQNNFNKCNL